MRENKNKTSTKRTVKNLSKTAQKRIDQKINVQLAKRFIAENLESDRNIEDAKDKITVKSKRLDVNNFNSKSFIDAMKESGLNIEGNNTLFSDMERAINKNDSIVELVDIKNIRMKTVVSDEQHKYIIILNNAYNTMKKRWGVDVESWRNILQEFIELSPSIEGKRAGQFVTAHQALADAVAKANAGSSNQITNTGANKE